MVKSKFLPQKLLLGRMIKMNESKAMREIHEIREKHYEETRHLSPNEYIANIRKGANKASKRIEEMRKQKPKAG